MKIFFSGSPRALKINKIDHEKIYKIIESEGYVNLSKLVVDADPNTFYLQDYLLRKRHFKDTLKNLIKCDIFVCEISIHSLSMGFLIAKAIEFNKPVIALYKHSSEPFFLTGLWHDKVQIVEYKTENIQFTLRKALEVAKATKESRFNFLIDSHLHSYLNFLSHKSSQPKAAIVRDLIKDTMISDEAFLDYQAGFTQLDQSQELVSDEANSEFEYEFVPTVPDRS